MNKIITSLLLSTYTLTSNAYVVGFTPADLAEYPQNQDISWDMTSDGINPSSPLAPTSTSRFTLTGHGDFHFSMPGASMTGESKGSWPKGGNLPVGSLIDQNSKWIDNMAASTDEWDPGCAVGNTCIYGVQFQILGDVHYGWVEFHEGLTNQSLIRWAYESNANIGILAGDMGAIPIAPDACTSLHWSSSSRILPQVSSTETEPPHWGIASAINTAIK